jgi:hypothetical protein
VGRLPFPLLGFTPPTSLPPFPKNRKNIVLKTKYIPYDTSVEMEGEN